jgi:hypothetical protein
MAQDCPSSLGKNRLWHRQLLSGITTGTLWPSLEEKTYLEKTYLHPAFSLLFQGSPLGGERERVTKRILYAEAYLCGM